MLRPCVIVLTAIVPAIAADKITFDDHVLPIFQQACLNCHNPDKTKGGLDLSSYSGSLKGGSGGKIVEPGDSGSKLIAVVTHSAEPVMPPEGDKLANDQIETLRNWIAGGLLENRSATARKPSKPKFAASAQTDPASKPEGPPPMPQHLLLEPPVVTENGSAVQSIAASPWAPLIAITGQRQVLLHHSDTLDLVGILPFPEGDPTCVTFTPEGRYLLIGGGVPGKTGITVTIDVTTGHRLLSAAKEFDSLYGADIRPGFDIVATGGPSRLLKLWDTGTGEMRHSIKKHTDWITTLDISPDGVLIASADRNGGLWVWEAETGAEFHNLRGHQAAIRVATFRSDSNLLASASEDGTIRYWEMNGGTEVRKNDAHSGGVTAFAFARDGTAVSAGRDRVVKLWKPDFGHLRDLAKDLPTLPTAAALDAEGKRAFIGDASGLVRVYQTSDGAPLAEISNHPPSIATRLQLVAQKITDQEKTQPQATESLTALRKEHKHWTAAEINTRYLSTSEAAAENLRLLEQLHEDFTPAAITIATQAQALSQKRHQRKQLAMLLENHQSSAEHLAEIEATLAAIDIVIERELDRTRQAESNLQKLTKKIDPTASAAVSNQTQSEALREEYMKALE